MAWLTLTAAVIFEVAGTMAMKHSNGFAKLVPSLLVFAFYGVSFSLFIFALKHLELSIAYAFWAGAGTALVAGIGIIWFGETVSPMKLISICLIVVGVIGLHLTSRGA